MTRKEQGALIREARGLAGWTVAELALKLGVPERAVDLAEREAAGWPAGSQVKAVAVLLDEFSDRAGVPRVRPKLAPLLAARLLSIVVARARRSRGPLPGE